MTTAPPLLDDAYPSSTLVEKRRILDRFAVEALRTSFASLGIGAARRAPDTLWHLAIGVALVAGTGAFTEIAFLTVGSAAR